MKKPEITIIPTEITLKGKSVIGWQIEYDGEFAGIIEKKDHAEAYSEMIDALVEAHGTLKNCLYRGERGTKIASTHDKVKSLEQIEQALKKAGLS